MKRAVFITLLIMIITAGMVLLGYSAYYFILMPNNSIVSAFQEDKLNLVIADVEVFAKDEPRIIDGEILLPMDVVKEYIDPYIYWDNELKKVTITTKDKVIRMKTHNLDALVNNEYMTLNIPVIQDKESVFIPIEFLAEFYGIEVTYSEDNNVIIIDKKNVVVHTAEPIVQGAVVRKGRSIRYPVIRKFSLDTENNEENVMRIFEEYDKWYKVRTSKGEIGYIEKKHVVAKLPTVDRRVFEDGGESLSWRPEKGKINLVWEMIYSGRPDFSKIPQMEGLDVISPTWFQFKDRNGSLINRADPKYVEWAHSKGLKVWALLSNDFTDLDMTRQVLNNTDARENVIKEILAYSALYKLDGINIDIENLGREDRDALTQFMREITPLLREQGLVVSIDINMHACYDRTELGKIVDYVMLMAYDQHWRGSPNAGSVAQVSWVDSIVEKTLKDIPAEKLLLGLPFYTRMWQEEPDSSGKINLSSKVLNMDSARETVESNNISAVWDDESGQFYAEFAKEGSTYKIWIEDANSINLKSSLVHKHKLAGTAAWRRSDESSDIWEVLNRNLKTVNSYFEWKEQNSGNKYVFNR